MTVSANEEKLRAKENQETREQNKSPENDLNKTKISDLLGREFKIIVTKMMAKVKNAMHEQVRISIKRY